MGSAAIRSSLAFPGLKLVGVITSSADKVGRDAAAFAGLTDATGITATTDVDAALAECDALPCRQHSVIPFERQHAGTKSEGWGG